MLFLHHYNHGKFNWVGSFFFHITIIMKSNTINVDIPQSHDKTNTWYTCIPDINLYMKDTTLTEWKSGKRKTYGKKNNCVNEFWWKKIQTPERPKKKSSQGNFHESVR